MNFTIFITNDFTQKNKKRDALLSASMRLHRPRRVCIGVPAPGLGADPHPDQRWAAQWVGVAHCTPKKYNCSKGPLASTPTSPAWACTSWT